MRCGVGHRHGSDSVLLWLWCRPETVALIRTLAWKLPYATGAALKKKIFTTLKKEHKLQFLQHAVHDPAKGYYLKYL